MLSEDGHVDLAADDRHGLSGDRQSSLAGVDDHGHGLCREVLLQ